MVNDELEAFLVLAEELHFGRTAERLRVTTSRISQTIKKLERRVGTPLFVRTSRRVELTPVGRELYGGVRPAWDAIGAAMERAIAHGRGRLCTAFTGAAAGQLLAGIAELFQRREPGCEVEMREVQPGEVARRLRDGEVELVLTTLPVEGHEAGDVLVREVRMVAVAATHPLAGRTSVSESDLAGLTVLEGPLQEGLTLVGAGRGVLRVGAHTRRYHPRPDVVYVQVADAPPLEWGLVWRAGAATPRVRAFHQAALDLLKAPS
ncbi:LysR family transcriptional regulator [Nonomuraea sp. NPDC050556]|uniref:LysR family transcriptional regulator n=1 Tax=Nonomuraea sp. NPDC050556 TaxID=3364369 RepID=UPI0037A3D135